MANPARPRALGKGLSSLMGKVPITPPAVPATPTPATAKAPEPPAAPAPPPATPVKPAKAVAKPVPAPAKAPEPAKSAPKPAPAAATPPAAAAPAAASKPAPKPAEPPKPVAPPAPPATATPTPEGLHYLPVLAIRPNPHQPRQTFDPAALQQLANSIKSQGVMQPIVARALPQPLPPARQGGPSITHELVAGERRWRAAQIAGLTTIPTVVRALTEQQLAQWALVENLQREDLNPIEKADAFQALIQKFHYSHEQIAQQVGLDRATITNTLRLLELAPEVRQLLRDGRLSPTHARYLLPLTDPKQQWALAEKAVKNFWSVKQLEQAAKELLAAATAAAATGPSTVPGTPAASASRNAHLADLENQIGQHLQTRVHLKTGRKKGSGSLSIEYYSIDHFETILARLGIDPD